MTYEKRVCIHTYTFMYIQTHTYQISTFLLRYLPHSPCLTLIQPLDFCNRGTKGTSTFPKPCSEYPPRHKITNLRTHLYSFQVPSESYHGQVLWPHHHHSDNLYPHAFFICPLHAAVEDFCRKGIIFVLLLIYFNLSSLKSFSGSSLSAESNWNCLYGI